MKPISVAADLAAAAPKDAGMSAEEGWGYNPKQAGIIPKSLGV